MIGIVDYGLGNLRSVEKAVQFLGVPTIFVQTPEQLDKVDGIVVPGQGGFRDCGINLKKSGLWSPLQEWIKADRPYFGICLGYQILFEESEEAPGQEGLGAFKGKVVRFPESELKVPQMGWNSVKIENNSPFVEGIQNGDYVYFVHSYYPQPTDRSIWSLSTNYGVDFISAVSKGNLFAAQFHPEKSQRVGLQLLKNFINKVESGVSIAS